MTESNTHLQDQVKTPSGHFPGGILAAIAASSATWVEQIQNAQATNARACEAISKQLQQAYTNMSAALDAQMLIVKNAGGDSGALTKATTELQKIQKEYDIGTSNISTTSQSVGQAVSSEGTAANEATQGASEVLDLLRALTQGLSKGL